MPERETIVLLHGVGMSARVWDAVKPLLEPQHDVLALTALGHRGGAAASHRPVRVSDLVDEIARTFGERGIGRAHLVGNSLGGWVALELARRGLARSVCAFSPAGCWTAGTREQTAGARKIRRLMRSARLSRGLPLRTLMRFSMVRRLALRDVAEHGERLSAEQAFDATRDLVECEVADDILSADDQLEPLDPLPCPITIAWPSEDALLPVDVNGRVARERMPHADFVVLPGLGHVPMIDDADAVARMVRDAAARA